MPAITPERTVVTFNNEFLERQCHGPWWKYRHILIGHWGSCDLPPEAIGEWAGKIAEYVEIVELTDGVGTILEALLSGLCSTCAPSLRKFSVQRAGAPVPVETIFSSLCRAPALVELALQGVRFSPKTTNIEQFFVETNSLKTLELHDISVPRVYEQGRNEFDAVINEFTQGLKRNQSLTKIIMSIPNSETPTPWGGLANERAHCLLMRGCLLGIANNRHVQEFTLQFNGNRSPHPLRSLSNPEPILTAIQELVSRTTSVRKLEVNGDDAVTSKVFLGLVDNLSIKDVDIQASISEPERSDEQLSIVIEKFCASNKTIEILKCSGRLEDDGFGPRSRAALADGLRRLEALKEVCFEGCRIAPDVLEHIGRLQNVELLANELIQTQDWEMLSRGLRDNPKNNLQAVDLSHNSLLTRTLERILPGLSQVPKLTLNNCWIYIESIPLICDFIRDNPLKELSLFCNPIGSQGVASVLEAVSTNISVEHLKVGGPGPLEYNSDTGRFEPVERVARNFVINMNDCHESLRTLLIGCRLVSLELRGGEPLDLESLRSLAAGLRENATLKRIRLPGLKLEFIYLLGEALVDNDSLETFEVYDNTEWSNRYGCFILKKLGAAEEEGMIRFIRMLPRMKKLTRMMFLFDFERSERLTQALIEALKENTVLKDIEGNAQLNSRYCHICHNDTVQFYLQLNRLGRHQYISASENAPIPPAVLPHVFARMAARPEFTSHLYFFVRRTSPELLAGAEINPSKRRANVSPGC